MNNHLHNIEVLEEAAEKTLSTVLKPILDVTLWLLGHAPTVIRFTKRKTLHIPSLVQHILLKQAMASLRATSHILVRGYTAQASMIASSLFEISLYSSYMLDDPDKVEKFLKHPNSQDFVWTPKEMIRHLAEKRLLSRGREKDTSELKSAVELINGPYIYLCSLKHSNPIPLLHVVDTRVDEVDLVENLYPFAVLPDTRPEDNLVKTVILAEANKATFEVAANAAHTTETPSKEHLEWLDQIVKMQSQHLSNYEEMGKRFGPMPFQTIRR